PRSRDELHLDWQNCLRDNRKPAFHQQIEHTHDRARQRILHRCEERVSRALSDGREGGLKRRPWHRGNGAAEKLDGGFFAERAGFALKSHAHGLAIGCAHRQALSCNKERKTKSTVSLRTAEILRLESGRRRSARKLLQAL